MISTRSAGLVIDTVVCLTLAKWETVSGQFGGYLTHSESAGGASCHSRRRISCVASQRDRRNKAIAAPRDIDNEPIPITSVTQPAAQCRNMDGQVGRLDK